MSEGASFLTVGVPRAQPLPPDIAVQAQVPGGKLLPCTPFAPSDIVNRTEYRLPFPVPQGNVLTVRRIHLKLPVFIEEDELEKQVTVEITKTKYETNAEREAAFKSKGGHVTSSESHVAIGPNRAYERITSTKAFVGFEGELVLLEETVTTTERSVLPSTVAVVARLNGPEGEIWSEAFEVPCRYVEGAAGKGIGTGTLDSYADLQNGITMYPEKTYSLALFVLVPAAVKTSPVLGALAPFAPGDGAITLFYDVETVPVGK